MMEAYKFFKDVSKTDPKHTKNVKESGGRTYTTIDAYWLIEQATKHFDALYGSSWGLFDIAYDKTHFPNDTVVLSLSATFKHPSGEFPISNAVKFAYMTKGGDGYLKIDEDAYKKLETNTISKALSRIGFGADVYSGKFEDQYYVGEIGAEMQPLTGQQLQNVIKGMNIYGVNAKILLDHFIVSRIAEIPASKYNEATALIKSSKTKEPKTKDDGA